MKTRDQRIEKIFLPCNQKFLREENVRIHEVLQVWKGLVSVDLPEVQQLPN